VSQRGRDIHDRDSVDLIAPMSLARGSLASARRMWGGPSALLCAKAHKILDRLDPPGLRRNRDRLRPKGFADLYRLLLPSHRPKRPRGFRA
jgi:hypothetical protein